MKILDLIAHLNQLAVEQGNLDIVSDGYYQLRAPVVETNQDLPAEWNVPEKFVRLRIND